MIAARRTTVPHRARSRFTPLTQEHREVLLVLSDGHYWSAAEIAALLGYRATVTGGLLRGLVSAGLVEKLGPIEGHGLYKITKRISPRERLR